MGAAAWRLGSKPVGQGVIRKKTKSERGPGQQMVENMN